MRERLVVMLVGMTVAVIALFGVPRAYATADLVRNNEQEQVTRALQVMSVAVGTRQQDQPPVTESFLASLRQQDERLVYVAPDGTRVVSGSATSDDSDFSRSTGLRGGGSITLSQPDSVVAGQVANALLPLVVLALVLAVLAAALGLFVARRLARPFRQLADSATEIGNGRFDLEVPHFSIPEAEEVGEALRRASRQLDQLVHRERDFAINASHRLRTPITGLRLSLEDLTLWPQTPPDVSAELTASLAELDRLSAAITSLLDRRQDELLGAPVDIDLTTLARSAIDRWHAAAAESGRTIALGNDTAVPASLVTGPVNQVVDVLIDNALAHGTGRITVTTGMAHSYLRFLVADEGARTMPTGVLHESTDSNTPAGLSRAAALAESMGGYLGVSDTPLTTFVLALPRIPTPAVGGAAVL